MLPNELSMQTFISLISLWIDQVLNLIRLLNYLKSVKQIAFLNFFLSLHIFQIKS